MLRYISLFLLLGLAFGQNRTFKYGDCGSKAQVKLAQIEPCYHDPCYITQGETTKVYLTFIADQDSVTATFNAKVELLPTPIWMPIPFVKTDLCSYMLNCPIKKGQEYSGVLEIPFPKMFRTAYTYLLLEVKLDRGVSVCMMAAIWIQGFSP